MLQSVLGSRIDGGNLLTGSIAMSKTMISIKGFHCVAAVAMVALLLLCLPASTSSQEEGQGSNGHGAVVVVVDTETCS